VFSEKSLIIKIVTGMFGLALIAGVVINTHSNPPALADSNFNSNSNSNSNSPIVQAESNQLLRGNWNMTVTGIKFHEGSYDPSKKAADVELTFENAAGLTKSFLPKGNIVVIVRKVGKVYKLDIDHPIDKMYTTSEQARKLDSKDHGKTFNPGIFKLTPSFDVDSSEDNFKKVVYQDETGKRL
jgi:hypothetical protein